MEKHLPTTDTDITGQLVDRVSTMAHPQPTEIVTVRPDTETLTRQRLPYFVGISLMHLKLLALLI